MTRSLVNENAAHRGVLQHACEAWLDALVYKAARHQTPSAAIALGLNRSATVQRARHRITDLVENLADAQLAELTQADVRRLAMAAIYQTVGIRRIGLEALRDPLARSRPVFDNGATPFWHAVDRSMLPVESNIPDLKRYDGVHPDIADVDPTAAAWSGVDDYVESRLGPIAGILDNLSNADEVLFSNLPIAEILPQLDEVARVERLTLPVSSWEKEIHLIQHHDGHRTLVLGDFPGRTFMQHFQLLAVRRLSDDNIAPRITTIESEEAYARTYDGLSELFAAHHDAVAGTDAIVVGYAAAIKRAWAAHRVDRVSDEHWSTDVFVLPNGRKVAVCEPKGSTHGEILGESIKRLVAANPTIRTVLFGGSGGSALPRTPYSLVTPAAVRIADDRQVTNVLSSGTERVVHTSVTSPLVESPSVLRAMQREQITTVDMEVARLAESLESTGVELGFTILATDFPLPSNRGPSVELSQSCGDAKRKALRDYPQMLERFLVDGEKCSSHPIEAALGKPLEALSAVNMARARRAIGEISPDERLLFDRVRQLSPGMSIRLTRRRLQRALESQDLRSPSVIERLDGRRTTPLTPDVEDQVFGAHGYVFGSVGFGSGEEAYGDCVLTLRDAAWKGRSFASERSAGRVIADVVQAGGSTSWSTSRRASQFDDYDLPSSLSAADLATAQAALGREIFVPKDYSERLALEAVDRYRAGDGATRARMASAHGPDLERLLVEQGVRLEGKIKDAINLEDVEHVTVPEGAVTSLGPALAVLGPERWTAIS